MARGDHPQRTPFYGACLLAMAFLMCWPASQVPSVALRTALYLGAVLAAGVGTVMTLRDYSPPLRSRRGRDRARPRRVPRERRASSTDSDGPRA